jgi:propanediol dehydratase small subunit
MSKSPAKADEKSSSSYPVDKKGLELMAEAGKKLNKSGFSSLFSGGSKYEDAREIIQKAAAQFKIAKNWQEAGEKRNPISI